MKSGVVTPIKAPALLPMKASPMAPVIESPSIENCPKKPKIISFHLDAAEFCRNEGTYATSFCRQWYLLILRSFMCLYRDKSLAALRLCIHMIVGTLVGTLYFGIGNDASMIFNNFRYIFMSIMFLMFTSFSSMTIMCKYKCRPRSFNWRLIHIDSLRFSVPLEVAIVTREHFNRWYSVKAYYFALTFADLPIQIACVTIFVIITYLMTAQPLEWFRFGIFYAIICLVTLVSQGWGMIIGAVCDVKVSGFFFINLKCWKKYQKWTDRKRPFLLLLACTCYWTICHCTILGIFWIFSTFFRCTSSITLAISYIVFEACARRICFSHIRLWSTENGMRWNVLSLSHTKEIYGNYWYARG